MSRTGGKEHTGKDLREVTPPREGRCSKEMFNVLLSLFSPYPQDPLSAVLCAWEADPVDCITQALLPSGLLLALVVGRSWQEI